MAKTQDFSQMGDEEFMAAWSEASERAQAAQDVCHAYGAEHQRRLAAAAEARKAEKDPAGLSDLDQVVGSVE